MLGLLRRKKIARRILWGLAVIIIPAFMLWGAGNLSKRETRITHIGVIGGKKVPVDAFAEGIRDVQAGLFLTYFNQPQVLEEIQKDRSLVGRLAWENLIIQHAAKKERVSVTDKEVVDYIMRHPLFTRGTVFDSKLYDYIIRNSLGTSPRDFEESVRNYLLSSRYRANIIKNVTVSDDELRSVYENEHEKAQVHYVVVDAARFKDDVSVAPDEILSFYEAEKETFRDPEKVILEYVAFPYTPDDRDRVNTSMQAAFDTLRKRPRDMKKKARELGLTVSETLPFSQDQIVPEIDDIENIRAVAFRLRPNLDILPIVGEGASGTSYIIRVRERIPSRIKTADEVRPFITGVLTGRKALERAGAEARDLYKEAIVDNLSLRDIADAHGLELTTSGMVSRFDYIEGVGESYAVIDAAFALAVGTVSEPVEARKGFVIIEPLGFERVDEKVFEDEKEPYRNKVLAAKKMRALEEWFLGNAREARLLVDLDRI